VTREDDHSLPTWVPRAKVCPGEKGWQAGYNGSRKLALHVIDAELQEPTISCVWKGTKGALLPSQTAGKQRLSFLKNSKPVISVALAFAHGTCLSLHFPIIGPRIVHVA
jgi:hypothetical protein